MKKTTLILMFIIGLTTSLAAQKTVSDYMTKGNENYCLINISRPSTFQEVRGARKLLQMVYINDQPVCELECQNRVSIKVMSEGKLTLSVKYLPNKKYKQKTIDRNFHSGPPLELDVVHGKTYFLNNDIKLKDGFTINFTAQLVAIPESETMYKDEPRFEKFPEIREFQEKADLPFIKK